MRHGKKNNHLGRTAPHRKSMLSNMANSLIINKRIVTTVAKAKELRKYVEPLLTKSKEDTTHNRRIVFSYLKSKESIKALFGEVSEKIATRNGGYTRIIKLGTRQGDAAETAMIELVDYNDLLMASASEAPAKAKRTRRAGSKKVDGVVAAPAADVIQDAVVVDEPIAEAPVADEPIVDEVASSSEEAPETDNEASPDDEPAAQA
jgi:large subunit ribosomal protein L17